MGIQGELLGGVTGYVTYAERTLGCPRPSGYSGPVPNGQVNSNYVYHDAFGKNHAFNYTIQICPLTGDTATGNGSSSDGSGLQYGGSGTSSGDPDGYVHTRNGSIINAPSYQGSGSPSNGSITDSNGNMVTNNGNGTFTDTLGSTALTITGSGTPTSPLTLAYPVTLQASGASSASATIAYKAYTVQTNFQCSGITESGATSVNLTDHITLADGSTYSFSYEGTPGVSGAVTGRLASVTLPTGGVISYAYSGGCNGSGINADGTVAGLSRTTADSSNPRTYTRTVTGSTYTTQLQDEKNNQSQYWFTVANGVFYETQRSIGNIFGVFTCYNGVEPPCNGAAVTPPFSETIAVSSYNSGTQSSVVNKYDSLGSLTSSAQGPWGGTALQQTTYTYNSLEEVASVSQFDASGSAIAYTYYGFDETTPTATSGIPSHVAVTGTRGNVTSAHVSVGGSYLTTTTAYYDTGVPVSTTTPNGKTQYGYEATQTFATSTTLPTPSSGVSLATTAAYDSSSGAQLSVAGFNPNQATFYAQYDSRLRPTVINPPSGSAQIKISYSPTQIGVDTGISNTQTLLDAYGRKSRVAIANGQSTNPWYQIDYCYDATGLLQFQSTRYQGNGFAAPKQCSGNGTSYIYDALGRVTSTTNPDGTATKLYQGRAVESTDVNRVQKITQYDLIGRISGVCEISSNGSMPGSGSPGPCSMDIPGTGFSTSYNYTSAWNTTTITQGGQSRVVVIDPGGRTTSVTEPERGTTTYSYIYNSTGLQVTRTRPKANQPPTSTATTTTTTQYDSIGRPVSIVYNDSLTPSKTFVYDAAGSYWPNGSSATNLKGQLAVIGGSNTGALFSYDLEGHVVSMWQCGPSTCGNANLQLSRPPITLSYDGVGRLISEGDGVSGTIAYGRSPAGEVTSITNQTYTGIFNPANLVSNVVNGPNGPISYSLGNGLSVDKTYDSLGRVNGSFLCQGSLQVSCTGGTQIYGFTAYQVGAQLEYSCDTAVNQCLSYGYDEFNRLTAQNGPTSLSFVYDRWGNRTSQTVTQGSAPSPTYSFNTSNNQISSPTGFAYDAAGNLINDTVHSYTYDAEGNLLTVDGSAAKYVYDALNRRVSQQTASGTYEYLYDPAGRRISRWNVSNNSGDEGRIYWDGNQIAFRSLDGTTYFENQDWLGTERMRTNYMGAKAMNYSSLPWGDGYTPTSIQSGGTPDQDTLHFAQLDHDAESGTEHAQFRQYSSTAARWMSPDPYDGSYNPYNPQSFNRYTYAKNNPLARIDPSGMDDDGSNDCGESGGNNPDTGSGGGIATVYQSVDVTTTEPEGVTLEDPDDPCTLGCSATPIQIGQYTTPAPSNPTQPKTCIQQALMSTIPGLQNASQTAGAPGPYNAYGHMNETDTLTFSSPAAQYAFQGSTRLGLVPGSVSELGYGPGVRLGNGLHVEFYGFPNGQFAVTSHLDLFNPNNGLGPLLGHFFVDVLFGHIKGQNSGALDKGCPTS